MFDPLAFSATGPQGKAVSAFYKRLAAMVSEKQKGPYSIIMAYVRCRLGFVSFVRPLRASEATVVALAGGVGVLLARLEIIPWDMLYGIFMIVSDNTTLLHILDVFVSCADLEDFSYDSRIGRRSGLVRTRYNFSYRIISNISTVSNDSTSPIIEHLGAAFKK